MGTYIDDTFNWDDITWLRRSTRLPIFAKGIQTVEDAVLAMEHGLDGIIITNHGGRNLDTYANLDIIGTCCDIYANTLQIPTIPAHSSRNSPPPSRSLPTDGGLPRLWHPARNRHHQGPMFGRKSRWNGSSFSVLTDLWTRGCRALHRK